MGELIGKYKVETHLGDGTFGRVLGCKAVAGDRLGELFALKVIKAVEKYILTGQFEADVLVRLVDKGAPCMVNLVEQFKWGDNYVLVFP